MSKILDLKVVVNGSLVTTWIEHQDPKTFRSENVRPRIFTSSSWVKIISDFGPDLSGSIHLPDVFIRGTNRDSDYKITERDYGCPDIAKDIGARIKIAVDEFNNQGGFREHPTKQ